MSKRIDPEPISIYLAILATFTASVAAVNYVKMHHRPEPTRVRAKLVLSLTVLHQHTKDLRREVSAIEEIFQNASFSSGNRTIRLGNNAHVTESDFFQFEIVSDRIFDRLRKVHKLALRMEREAKVFGELKMATTTNVLGETYNKLTQLLDSRDLTIEQAWEGLRSIAADLERIIAELRTQLGGT